MALSMADIIARKLKLLEMKNKLPSKLKFGELMHGDELTEEQKRDLAEKVIMAGGYDGLPED